QATENLIEDFYYAGITGLIGTQYEWIRNNEVRHAVNRTGDGGLAYGIGAAGVEDPSEQRGPVTQHPGIDNNIGVDIPTWECYDTHGGTDQHFTNNQGSGCYYGIQAGTVDSSSNQGALTNLEISGNRLDRCGARENGYGIVVAGAGVLDPVNDATVSDN